MNMRSMFSRLISVFLIFIVVFMLLMDVKLSLVVLAGVPADRALPVAKI